MKIDKDKIINTSDIVKPELVICLGSSCFARGNKQLIGFIKNYLKEKDLENRVNFYGKRCYSKCAKGPYIKINEKLIENVDEDSIKSFLDDFFNN